MKPEDFAPVPNVRSPGKSIESLQDGREIHIYGERVKDVTTHPAFRNAAASAAQLYDALHKPEMQDLCAGTPTPAAAAIPQILPRGEKCRRPAPATRCHR